MENVYVVRQGTQLHKDGYRLVAKQGSGVVDEVPVQDLEQLIVVGNVMLTPPVMDYLIQSRVDTVFLSVSGRFRGRLLTQYAKNVDLRRRQYLLLNKPDAALEIARNIVSAKIGNQRIFLLRHNRKLKCDAVAAALAQMRILAEDALQAGSVDRLMGYEGVASRSYFSVFDRLLKRDDFVFRGRNRRPPRDPVNALLSFGYTMLANAVETAVNIVGLDPYLGAFHSMEYGRPSLVCDLMEEYRSFFVDALVTTLLNKKIINPDDFDYRDQATPPGDEAVSADALPVSMKRETMKGFVRIFEQKMNTRVMYEPTGENLTYRQIILNQVRHYARVMLEKDKHYKPFTWSR